MKKPTTIKAVQVKILLQGKVESFEEYEARLNKEMVALANSKSEQFVIALPCCAADGRMCCTLHYHAMVEVKKPATRNP